MIKEKAYGKINIGLTVGKERLDGYHEMNSIMVPISLYDELTFEESESGIVLLDNTNIKNEENFVYKAAKLFMEEYDINKGVIIRLDKKVPLEAGLGGGSSDAAATLRGLNRLFKKNISLDELASLATRLGSDMPFCVYQQAAFCYGRGELVRLIETDFYELKFLIVKPPYGLSTKDVYQNFIYDENVSHIDELALIEEGLKTKNKSLLFNNVFNDLEEAAFKLKPELKELKTKLEESGNIVFMSGSGTALCVFNESEDYQAVIDMLPFYTTFETYVMTKIPEEPSINIPFSFDVK